MLPICALRTRPAAVLRTYLRQQTRDTGYPISVRLPDGEIVGSTPGDEDGGPEGGGPPSIGPRPPSGGPGGSAGSGGGDGDRDSPAQVTSAPGGSVAIAVAPHPPAAFYQVRVYLSDSKRYEGLSGWYALIIGVSLGLIVLGIAAGELLTRRITRPLLDTARTAQRLSTGDVTARAPTDGPREVADVGIALNRLADRIDQLIVEERETVADLSHRLRTPLTRLRLDAEALHDPEDAERVSGRVSELERMLTAVIHAARRPQREGRLPSCDATAVVRERVEFWSALMDEQGRPSTISLPTVRCRSGLGRGSRRRPRRAARERRRAHVRGDAVRGHPRRDRRRRPPRDHRRGSRHPRIVRGPRTHRPRLQRPRSRHRTALRRGRRRVDDDRQGSVRWRLDHLAATQPVASSYPALGQA